MSSGFQWVIRPEDELIPNLEKLALRMEVGIRVIAIRWGQEIQNQARNSRTWDDKSGNARGGLFFAVDGFGMGEVVGPIKEEAKALMDDVEVVQGSNDTLIITLAHTVYYGKYLELSNGGKHAVIMSTIEENLPALERLLSGSGFTAGF